MVSHTRREYWRLLWIAYVQECTAPPSTDSVVSFYPNLYDGQRRSPLPSQGNGKTFFPEQSEKAMYDFDQISTTHGVVSADWQFDTEFNDTVTFL